MDNQQAVELELRKLQQVESARDPSRLIRAQNDTSGSTKAAA